MATLAHLQQYSAVRSLQQQKPRHPKQPPLPPGEADIVYTAVYKQKLNHYKEALNHYEQYIDQLLSEQSAQLIKIIYNVDDIVSYLQTLSKLANF